MTVKKKAYEKPMIQDLGRILTGSAQVPMGYCSGGDSPSGAVNQCVSGNGNLSVECNMGGLWHISYNVCQAGGGAKDDCSYGAGVG